jgi:CubicO group peptidase (beta-lactamase class C family)
MTIDRATEPQRTLPRMRADRPIRRWRSGRLRVRPGILLALALAAGVAHADAGLTGREVPDLWPFDKSIKNYKEAHPNSSGVLAVSKGGCIVYQRGFGGMPENAPMRIMSIEKAFTAAVIHDLVARGALSLYDFVFDLGQAPSGILAIAPWPELRDERLRDVTVEHLLHHQGGWFQDSTWDPSSVDPISGDRIQGDPMFKAREIAGALAVASPPSRQNIVRWVLGRRLDYDPGWACTPETAGSCNATGDNYSNFGYMVLGLIIEQRSGMNVAEYVRTRILAPEDWAPASDLYSGRTLPPDRGPREPAYAGGDSDISVFDPGQTPHSAYAYPHIVNRPDGVWHIESMKGHGNLVMGAAPLVRFMDRYWIQGGDVGKPRSFVPDAQGYWAAAGGLDGTRTFALQRVDGINIVVLMNDSRDGNEPAELAENVNKWIVLLGDNLAWPTRCVDGFWAEFGKPASVQGSYDRPFGSMQNLLAETVDGSKVQLRPGHTGWTGIVSERMRLEAPDGPVTIGVP